MGDEDQAQWEELSEHHDRLDDLDDRLNTVFPLPNTPAGAAQRIRLAVPTPDSVLTIGARGTATSEGRAIGPGGIALRTVQNLGAQILGSTIVDTDGLTIVHAGRAMRLVTQADLGIVSSQGLRAGTNVGDVEITAGDVIPHDPGFTVVPDMSVPAAPEVDTASPREAIESAKEQSGMVWDSLEVASGVRTWTSFFAGWRLPTSVTSGPHSSRVASVLNLLRVGWSTWDAVRSALLAATAAYDRGGIDSHSSGRPKIKVHGAGGVSITSPEAVTAYAGDKISVTAGISASLKAAAKVSVKSAGYAGLYGGATVSVSSEGPASVKSYMEAATVAGRFAELTGKQSVSVRSDGDTLVVSKARIGIEAPDIAISGAAVHQWAGRELTVGSGRVVEIEADQGVRVAVHDSRVQLSEQSVRLAQGSSEVQVTQDKITLAPSGGLQVVIDRSRLEVGRVRITRSESTLRGTVNLG